MRETFAPTFHLWKVGKLDIDEWDSREKCEKQQQGMQQRSWATGFRGNNSENNTAISIINICAKKYDVPAYLNEIHGK